MSETSSISTLTRHRYQLNRLRCKAVRVAHMDGARTITAESFSALVRKHRSTPSTAPARCAYFGPARGRSEFLAPAAASDSFPRWESFTREAIMHATASFIHEQAGVS
jgi:hypothetical protein